jgi:hypothetical protein
LRLLEETKVTLHTYSKLDDITTSKVYENVVLTESQDYIIEFQVPANITTVNVTVSTSVNVKIIILHVIGGIQRGEIAF